MTAYKLYTRDAVAWTPSGADTALVANIDRKGTALSVTEHDDAHKYLYTKITNLKFSDIDEDIAVTPAAKDILVYNGVDWTNVAVSGDGTITAGGVLRITKIGAGTSYEVTIAGAFVTTGGALTLALGGATNVTLPTTGMLLNNIMTDGTIYVGSAGNVATERTPSGDLTMDNTGNFTIAALAVEDGMLAGSITWAKLLAGSLSRVAVTTGAGVLTTSGVTTTELEYLDGATPGTLVNSKALVVSAGGVINTLTIGNINIVNGVISSTSGHISLTPNGASEVQIDTGVATTAFDLNGQDLLISATANSYLHETGVAETIALVLPVTGVFQLLINGAVDFDFAANQFSVATGSAAFFTTTAPAQFRATTQSVYSSAASTLDIDSNTTTNLRIGGNIQLALTDGFLIPNADNDIELGSAGNNFKTFNSRTLTSNSALSIAASGSIDINAGGANSVTMGGVLDLVGFYGSAGIVQPAAYTITNRSVDKTMDCDAAAAAEIADVLANLIEDLIDMNLLQGTVGP